MAKILSEETRKKISESLKGKPSGSLGKHWIGKPKTEEWKKKMVEIRKKDGRPWFSTEAKERMKIRIQERKTQKAINQN